MNFVSQTAVDLNDFAITIYKIIFTLKRKNGENMQITINKTT